MITSSLYVFTAAPHTSFVANASTHSYTMKQKYSKPLMSVTLNIQYKKSGIN